jgi:hypothetical protein
MRFVAALACLALAACGGTAEGPASPSTSPDQAAPGAGPGAEVERFFPLVDGHQWQYVTSSDEGDRGMLLVRARRTDGRHGELRIGANARRIELTAEGIALEGLGTFILKTPLARGASWRGEHGGVARIAEVGATIEVPLGRFTGCVVTVEERTGDRAVRYTTTFCPGVGITALVVEAGAASERAELRSYGPPVNIGPEGSTVTPPP